MGCGGWLPEVSQLCQGDFLQGHRRGDGHAEQEETHPVKPRLLRPPEAKDTHSASHSGLHPKTFQKRDISTWEALAS